MWIILIRVIFFLQDAILTAGKKRYFDEICLNENRQEREGETMLEKVDLTKKFDKGEYKKIIEELQVKLGVLQREAKRLNIPTIVVMEGWDAAGKGTLINELILSLDPRGINVYATKAANEEEVKRPYLWRFWVKLPFKGRIAVFDRSWYRRLLFERIEKSCTEKEVEDAFQDIPAFERQLTADGYLVVKLFLHISKKEQGKRLKQLAEQESTAWRVTERDWTHHKQYDDYVPVIEEMMQKTDSEYAPWTIVEAHDKRFATVKILSTVVRAMEAKVNQVTAAAQMKETAVEQGTPGALPRLDSSIIGQIDLTKSIAASEYDKKLKKLQERLRELEYTLYKKQIPVVVVFEGSDAAGKGGCIRRLTQNLDPRGYTVVPVASPTEEERAHPYLWRFWRAFPKAGHITIFDRSWYGRVLVERVESFCSQEDWRRAYKEINEMEGQFTRFGAVVVKFWLQIDQEEQLRRFEERTNIVEKQWKITEEDWRNREKWPQYIEAVDEMFFRTSTIAAPWTIVEANSKQYARIKVLETVIGAIEKRL